ncbi:LAMI_0G16072g1_1 [Lachancea mirantina]|uniref:LAMI_0G16072g1_1 n=1 Tax=Lachancea mirantina TaxID=1230905 RepID=A0A1G4KCI6_9SACH|nr:LAMI_0G16072g1_1 [Lachancea mirantina]
MIDNNKEVIKEGIGFQKLASTTFKRTSNGLICSDELRKVFSVLLICLNLKERPSPNRMKMFSNLHRHHSFTFYMKEAIDTMASFKLNVNLNITSVTVSYAIHSELATCLLATFMDAKLIHAPGDRTRVTPKDKVLLQPTPKGVAILMKFVRQIGLKELPPILTSPLNSMELFSFERSAMTDAIIHSDYFVSLLFSKLMGDTPNEWSPSKKSDKLPSLSQLIECDDESFTFESFDLPRNGLTVDSSNTRRSPTSPPNHDETRESPLAHRFFTNPDSTAHVQYYVSSSGLRLLGSKTVGGDVVDVLFTTKAMWQWLMDCTDIMYPREAVTVMSLFLRNGLIRPIYSINTENYRGKFSIGSKCFYTLTESGFETLGWKQMNKLKKNRRSLYGLSAQTSFISLADSATLMKKKACELKEFNDVTILKQTVAYVDLSHILKDPGMRHLFRNHLESEYCAENLDVYFEIKKFLKRMTILKDLMDLKSHRSQDKRRVSRARQFNDIIVITTNSALLKQANECLEIAYQIFSSYITVGAPFQLNIDHCLRESITEVVLNPQPCLYTKGAANSGRIECTAVKNDNDEFHASSCDETEAKSVALQAISGPANVSSFSSDTCQSYQHGGSAEETLTGILKTLRQLYPLFESVGRRIYRLMKVDSLPKFTKSEAFQAAASTLNLDSTLA